MEKHAPEESVTIKRVVLYGPESTGKTTLAKQLSDYFGVPWVPEFARDYLQNKWDLHRTTCERHDLVIIGQGQVQLEEEALHEAREAGKSLIVCDTDVLETLVYSRVYYDGWADERLVQMVRERHYDLYLLTGIDVPWQPDDLRDRPDQREEMYKAFHEALLSAQRPYLTLQGDRATRLETAVAAINRLL